MTRTPWAVLGLLVLASCGTKDGEENPDLRSNMPARSASYYVDNRSELTEMDKICGAWRASQRPVASWPAVVSGNCNSANSAKTMISNQSEIDKLRKEAGS